MRSAIQIATATKTARVSSETSKLTRNMRSWSFALMLSAVIGVFAGTTGLGINALFLMGVAENKGLMGILSLWLLIAAFPMLWLTAHCLDRLRTIDKAIRLDRCRKTGLQDEGSPAAEATGK